MRKAFRVTLIQSNLDLDAWLERISLAHPSEIEMGLERIKEVWLRLVVSSKVIQNSKVVTVAGTNGKGSTIAIIEAGCQSLGISVGSYTSPHIHRYNERVKINGEAVSDEVLVESFEQVEQARGEVPLTYFEFGTLSAFYILLSAGLDVVLLEVGLGGRLDAVNILDPDIAVIASVALDHTDWLGDDIEGIGIEKAGILRSGKTALFGESLPESCYVAAQKLGVEPLTYGRDFELDRCSADAIRSRLPINNIALANQVLMELSAKPSSVDIVAVLENLVLPGRLERYLVGDVEFYLDVAHNPHAAAHLARFAGELNVDGKTVVALYSSLKDKDIVGVVEQMAPFIDYWCIAPLLEVPRAASLNELESLVYEGLTKSNCKPIGDAGQSVVSFSSINNALKELQNRPANSTVTVLVFGSFYVVEATRSILKTQL